MYKKLLFALFLLPASLFAQNSYDLVYTILNTKCANLSCHSFTSSQSLHFDGSSSQVYSALFNQNPVNAAAHARGERLVWQDQPYQSYLLKRAGSWFDADLALPMAETDSHHINAGLTSADVEYIRQWIMNGAKPTGITIDTAVINAYYNDPARAPFFPKLPRPAVDSGMQVRYGPFFVRGTAGHNEVENLLMNQINFPTDMEITGVQGSMSSASHHFLLFKFPDSVAAFDKTGVRIVSLTGGITPFDGSKDLVAEWQDPQKIMLPPGTAFFWPKTTYLDLDYHVKNYTAPGNSGIMPFDFYLNIFARPRNVSSNVIEMKSRIVNNAGIALVKSLPSTWTIDYADGDNGNNETRYLWLISSHTHKFGRGFNIYSYDNSRPNNFGDTLYVGTYDYAHGFDNGLYDWEHPSLEYFAPQKPINMRTGGFICRTDWDLNTSSAGLVHFGFTTDDEMQLYYYMYTSALPNSTAVNEVEKSSFDFVVYPNPMSVMGTIAYTLESAATVKASVTDITGKEVAMLKNEKQQAGTYNVDLGTKTALPAGMYFARVSVNGETFTKKFVVE